jgi:hypothetical protein
MAVDNIVNLAGIGRLAGSSGYPRLHHAWRVIFFACMQILDPHSFRCGALVPSSSITGSIAQETLGDGGRCNTWPTTPSPLSNCSSETRSFFLRSKTTLPWPYHDVTWMPPLNLCVCRPGPPTIATCETDFDRLTRRGGRLAPTQPGSTSDSRRR